MISLPITCPTCGTRHPEQFPLRAAVIGMARRNRMWLHSTCHHQQWNASDEEVSQIKAFLTSASDEYGPLEVSG